MRACFLALIFCLFAGDAAQAEPPQWLTLPPTPSLPQAAQSGYAPINGIRIWYASFGSSSKGETGPQAGVHHRNDHAGPAVQEGHAGAAEVGARVPVFASLVQSRVEAPACRRPDRRFSGRSATRP